MRVSHFCLLAAILSALIGMSLGIWMGLRADLTLAPVHAHINLLGWVSLALFGLYHRGAERPSERLAWAQVACSAAAVPLMTGGLAAYLLTHDMTLAPIVIGGAVLAVFGMALFLAVVIGDMRGAYAAPAPRTA
jgi:hypothetical protein